MLTHVFMKGSRLTRTIYIVVISCLVSGTLVFGLRILSERSALSHIRAKCDHLSDTLRDSCVVDELATYVIAHGSVQGAYRLVERMAGGTSHFGYVCSRLMSGVGTETYDDEPNFTRIDFGRESTYCNYGFMQSYVREMTITGRDPEKSHDFCVSVERALGHVVPGSTQECYRGIGQSLPFVDASLAQRPDDMIAYSIGMCESLTRDPVYRKFCISGAFQYLDVETSRQRYGLAPEQPDPLAICKRQPEKYVDLCYGNTKRVVLGPPGFNDESDYAAVIRDVRARFPHVSSDTMHTVMHTLAYDDVYTSEPVLNYTGIAHKCAAIEPELRQWCVWGAATGISKNAPKGLQVDQLEQWCEAIRSVIGERAASNCISSSGVEFLAGTISREALLPLCEAYATNIDCKNL